MVATEFFCGCWGLNDCLVRLCSWGMEVCKVGARQQFSLACCARVQWRMLSETFVVADVGRLADGVFMVGRFVGVRKARTSAHSS